jgi:hypothetical protein
MSKCYLEVQILFESSDHMSHTSRADLFCVPLHLSVTEHVLFYDLDAPWYHGVAGNGFDEYKEFS